MPQALAVSTDRGKFIFIQVLYCKGTHVNLVFIPESLLYRKAIACSSLAYLTDFL
jgi:hypothetical protein